MKRRFAVLAIGLALWFPGRAVSQQKEGGGGEKARAAEPGKKVLRPGELKVQGEVQKPKATPITPPALALPREFEHFESFAPKVLKALDKEPF
ncbi:MAG TPA: hypothetical protein VMT17_12740 [Anaeromyxobacteraceae bacterium]|nr:hypothetical protein [Anaeromyxobacteraceae bacterium]